MFVWGESIGWSSVVNPILRKSESGLGIDDDGSSWIGSTISIGGFIGGLMAGEKQSNGINLLQLICQWVNQVINRKRNVFK
jgi:hypothetical protein